MDGRAFLQGIADGNWHTGSKLAKSFGISRSAVWQWVRRLNACGLGVESMRGQGYRLAGGADLLSAEYIQAALAASHCRELCGVVDVRWLVDSTNDCVLAWLDKDVPNGSVCIAEGQRKGRGRSGRAWVSPPTRGLYFSLLWRFSSEESSLEGLSLAVGVTIVRALESLGVVDLGLKWPNDIVWRRRKLGGVLVELRRQPSGAVGIVLGIGVNCSLLLATQRSIGQPSVNLSAIVQESDTPSSVPSRNDMVVALLRELLPLLSDYGRHGFSVWRQAWQDLDVSMGERVVVRCADESIVGLGAGVSARGDFCVQTDSGCRTFSGGILSMSLK